MPKIVIADYDPSWPLLFEQERERLQAIVPDGVTIEHIGSSSIPGLAAKPVIDILIGVSSLAMADALCIAPIVQQGYTYVPEHERIIPDRRYFRKTTVGGTATHHIHLVVIDGPHWSRHLLFRDYLRAHPEQLRAYEQLKKDLATRFTDTLEYANAKTEFVKNIEVLAHADKAHTIVPDRAHSSITISQFLADDRSEVIDFYTSVGYQGVVVPDDTIVVARDSKQLVGVVRLAREEGVLVLRGMQVAASHQKRGIGSAMLQFLIAHINEPCYCLPHAWLEDFYGAIGFVKISSAEAPAFLQDRCARYKATEFPDLIVMKRS